MEAIEQIKKFQEFFEVNHKIEILEKIRKGEKFLAVNFSDLSRYEPELADNLLEEPEEVIKAAEIALGNVDENSKNFRIRFISLPESQKIMIRNVRSVHLGKFLFIEGVVRQKSDVRPQVTAARFECPSCGETITILQLDSSFREPSRCSCGRKGKFRLLSKELVDAQGLVLEEAPEQLEGGEQPKRISVFLQGDLVSPMSEKKTSPGSKIRVIGLIKEVPIILRNGAKSTRFDIILEANNVESLEETFFDVAISPEEEQDIMGLSQEKNLFERLVRSIAPSIYGYEKIKEALVFQLVGGVQKKRKDGTVVRGDTHILLVGDPGSGKSQLLKRINVVAPKARYISGKGVSTAGLTAAVVRDEFLRGWSLEAGAMVLASDGICAIDELDKMTQEDTSAMHEAMENQTVSISKATIQATLIARTTVLAAANPKLGRFNPFDTIARQINLPPTLINRFDLIFPIHDVPDKANDEKLASHILMLHKSPDMEEPEIPTKVLRKYIAYAKKMVPKLTEEAMDMIKEYYIETRSLGASTGDVIKPIPISPRQLEALVRLSEASARIRLSDKVTRKDAERAIELVKFCLQEVGYDKETGKLDIDRITIGTPTMQRSNILTIKEIIMELENKIGKLIPIEDVVRSALERKIERDKTEEIVERLRRQGDIFEPRRGFIQRM